MQKLIRPLFSLFQNSAHQINEQKRTVTHYISGGEPNDYGQVLNPAGYDDQRYRKNPIVLFQHGLCDMFNTTPARVQLDFVLGKNTAISVDGNYLKAETEFRDDDKSDFARDVYNLYRLGFLNGWSKWFYPISEPRAENGYVYYDKWGIYEYSAVFVPVDGDSTTQETNFLNALESVKSESMKKYFMHSLITGRAGAENDSLNLLSELQNIKSEIRSLDSAEHENEFKALAGESIEKYHKLIMPKLEHFADSIKQLNDLGNNLVALVEKAVKRSVDSIMGKIE